MKIGDRVEFTDHPIRKGKRGVVTTIVGDKKAMVKMDDKRSSGAADYIQIRKDRLKLVD